MKKNTNIFKICTAFSYTEDPELTEGFKRNKTELPSLRTSTILS